MLGLWKLELRAQSKDQWKTYHVWMLQELQEVISACLTKETSQRPSASDLLHKYKFFKVSMLPKQDCPQHCQHHRMHAHA